MGCQKSDCFSIYRQRIASLWFLLVTLIGLGSPVLGNERPNVLFIAVDDLRPSIGCYGDKLAITPNMDRLASRGLQFDRAYCQVAVCNPSRASLMTGLRPDNLGVWTLPIHFREAKPDAITMPQWFRKHGYTAVSHGKIFHNPTPDPQSWSEPIRPLSGLPYPYPRGTRDRIRSVDRSLPANDWRKNILRGPIAASPEIADHRMLDGARTDMAIQDLRRLAKSEKPFFLAMGYIRPHLAWISPKKYWDMHDRKKFPTRRDEKVNPNTPRYAMFSNREMAHYVDLAEFPEPWDKEKPSAEKVQYLLHAYYACVSYVDAQIGRLLKALEDEGLADNTIVVLWSDHGWKLGEYSAWGKRTNYEIDTRVPLIISAPGMKHTGKRTNQLVELLDLYPTLCDLAGIDIPQFVDGKSLRPVLNDIDKPIHEGATSQYYRRDGEQEYMGYAIRTDRYRYVEWRDFQSGAVRARELYDHRSDPNEKKNIAATASSEQIQVLVAKLLKTHPRKKLNLVPMIHSSPEPGRMRVGLTFSNETETTLLLNLIQSSGRRAWKLRAVKRVKPGEKLAFDEAKLGDVYVVESVDGKHYEIHSPAYPRKVVTIK